MRNRRVLPILALVALTGACSARSHERHTHAALPSATGMREQASRLGEDLARWEAFGFSGSVLIAQGGRTLLSGAYGEADRSTKRPVTPDTLFDIGSLSKQFTAAAILSLAERGRLAIQSPITEVLPGVPADKASITIHHLLTHTSGISDFGKEDEVVSRDALVAEIMAAPLSQPPGTAYEYSNLGYTLLAAIVERVSGERFEEYLEHFLLEPAGLRHTTFAWVDPLPPGTRIALGYGGFEDPVGGEDPAAGPHTWRERGNGGVLSTARDLVTWYRALTAGEILGAGSRATLFAPHTTAEADFLSYGYGWRIQSTDDGGRLIWHSGLEGAFSAMFRHYVNDDVLVVFLSNLSVGGVPMREVLVPPSRSGPPSSRLFADRVALAPRYVADAARLEGYPGRYLVSNASWWEAGSVDSALMLQAAGQEAVDTLFPPGDASVEAMHEKANRDAERMAHCLLDGTCDAGDVARIDPLGFAGRDAGTIGEGWRRDAERLGRLRSIRALGTTGLRGRHAEQQVTFVRLEFARGFVDEHVIWFADDEIYWIRGRPATFSIRFRPDPAGGLVGFDLLTQRLYLARIRDGSEDLVVETGDHRTRGKTIRAAARLSSLPAAGAAGPR